MHLDLTFTSWNRQPRQEEDEEEGGENEKKPMRPSGGRRRGVQEANRQKKKWLNQLNDRQAEIQLENRFNIKLQSPDTINYLLMTPI